MRAIIDPVDLSTPLSDRVENKNLPTALLEFQSKIDNIQFENSEINEQLIKLMTKNSELNKVVASLKAQMTSLKQQKEAFKQQHGDAEQRISKEEEKILLLISKAGKATAHQIICKLKYDLTVAEYWLERLCDNDMVFFSTVVNQKSAYYLGQEGRKYLIENKLVANQALKRMG